jgi:type 1 glutamine amidotransferase
MNEKKTGVLVVWGGWDGHEPGAFARLLEGDLARAGCEVRLEHELSVLENEALVRGMDLIVPIWTMGRLSKEQGKSLCGAVRAGTGLAGFHGGMGDAFRGELEYEWMTGGHFAGHPYVGPYEVRRTAAGKSHEATAGLPDAFAYTSEQYYMLMDPGVEVLAETAYLHEGREVAMPVIWTKSWGLGRVFYSALGHKPKEFLDYPHVREMTVKGLLWAARK